MQYYYTISSLPFLHFLAQPPFSLDYFWKHYLLELTEEDKAVLRMSQLDKPHHCPDCLLLWSDWEKALSNVLLNFRLETSQITQTWDKKNQLKKYKYHEEHSFNFSQLKQNLNKIRSLGQREKYIDQERWHYLDSLIKEEYSFSALCIYYIKLQILIKYSVKDKEENIYTHLRNTLLDPILEKYKLS